MSFLVCSTARSWRCSLASARLISSWMSWYVSIVVLPLCGVGCNGEGCPLPCPGMMGLCVVSVN